MEMWTNNKKCAFPLWCSSVLIVKHANGSHCICNFVLMTWCQHGSAEQLLTVNIAAFKLSFSTSELKATICRTTVYIDYQAIMQKAAFVMRWMTEQTSHYESVSTTLSLSMPPFDGVNSDVSVDWSYSVALISNIKGRISVTVQFNHM